MEDGHCVRADSPLEGDPGGAQQKRAVWVLAGKRLMPGHLGAYELATAVDEGEECAVAVHGVGAMLDQGIQRQVVARGRFDRGARGNVEGERGC
jgi:hypothetical protein